MVEVTVIPSTINQISDIGDVTLTSIAQGDILHRDGSNEWVNLAVGTSGHFLKTQGAGSNPIWATIPFTATKITEGTLSVDTSTIDIQNIPTGYKMLYLIMNAKSNNATADVLGTILNNDTTATNYHAQLMYGDGVDAGAVNQNSCFNCRLGNNGFATVQIVISCGSATFNPTWQVMSGGGKSADAQCYWCNGIWEGTIAEVNRITLDMQNGQFDTGTTYILYGWK